MEAAAIWDKMARKYAQSPIRNEAVYRDKLNATQAYFTPDTEVFEFGCGTGTTAIEHAPHVRQIVATDISANMLEIGREKATAANIDNISFEQASMADYDPPAEQYDVVLALNLVHLLENPQAANARAYKMLKPGGIFVTSTVCLGDSGSVKMLLFRMLIPVMQLLGKAPYVAYQTRAQVLADLEVSGFSIDYARERAKGEAAFLIARKPGTNSALKLSG
ncbi:unnamed protein product [Discosporangium mesarthrocarpum]